MTVSDEWERPEGYCGGGHYIGDQEYTGCRACAVYKYRREKERRAERRGAWDEENQEWKEVDTSYWPDEDTFDNSDNQE